MEEKNLIVKMLETQEKLIEGQAKIQGYFELHQKADAKVQQEVSELRGEVRELSKKSVRHSIIVGAIVFLFSGLFTAGLGALVALAIKYL